MSLAAIIHPSPVVSRGATIAFGRKEGFLGAHKVHNFRPLKEDIAYFLLWYHTTLQESRL